MLDDQGSLTDILYLPSLSGLQIAKRPGMEYNIAEDPKKVHRALACKPGQSFFSRSSEKHGTDGFADFVRVFKILEISENKAESPGRRQMSREWWSSAVRGCLWQSL